MDAVHVPAPAAATENESEPARKRARRLIHPYSLRLPSSDQFSSSASSDHTVFWYSRHYYDQLRRNMANSSTVGLPAESCGSTAGPVNAPKRCKYTVQTPTPSPTRITTPAQQLQLGEGHPQTLVPLPQTTVSLRTFPAQTSPQPHVSCTMLQSNANQQHFLLQTTVTPCSFTVFMVPPAATPVTPTRAFGSSAAASNRNGISPNLGQLEETADTDDCMSTCNSVPKQLSEILKFGSFFVLRGSADHISKSIDDAIWRCEGYDEEEMDDICLAAEQRSARLIFFILDKSTGKYGGVAEMAGHANVGDRNQIDFPIHWHLVKDISPECFDGVTYSEFTREHLIRTDMKNSFQLTWNEGLEMIEAIGDKLTRAFRAYRAPTPTAQEMNLRRGVMERRGRSFFCFELKFKT